MEVPIAQWKVGKGCEHTFLQRTYTNGQCSTSLLTREMKIAVTRMTILEKMENYKCWGGCEEIRTLVFGVGMYNGAATVVNSLLVPQNVKCEATT